MYKATYNDIKALINNAKDDEEVRAMVARGLRPVNGHDIAYFTPSNANWSYIIGIYQVNGELYELVTVYGTVEGGRRLFIYNNDGKGATYLYGDKEA